MQSGFMAVSGSRAMGSHESCQVREEAAISGSFHVPRVHPEAVINHVCISLFIAPSLPRSSRILFLLFFLTMRRHPFLWPISHFIENGVPCTFSEVVGQKHISIRSSAGRAGFKPAHVIFRSARYGKDQYGKNSRKSREL